jgi:hypothetical protein
MSRSPIAIGVVRFGLVWTLKELLLPANGFMEVDTHVCWYNGFSLLMGQMDASIVKW